MPEPVTQTILAVDDDRSILDVLDTALRFAGFEVHLARSGSVALEIAADHAVDLVVLDVNLPDLDGFEVCRRLRGAGSDVPVLFLTARDADTDKINGFELGADDYLTKPFKVRELVARIRAILKRTQPSVVDRNTLAHAGVELDIDRHRVTRDGVEVPLAPVEFRLLRYLMLNAEHVVSKDQILERVWGPFHEGDAGRVEATMSYLRKKLGPPDLIHTLRNVGYTMRGPEA